MEMLAVPPATSRALPRWSDAAPASRRSSAASQADDREFLFSVLSPCLGWMEAAEASEAALSRFGGFAEAVAAEESALAALPALGQAGAAVLKAVHVAALRLEEQRRGQRPVLGDAAAQLAYLRGAPPAGDEVRALFLDARGRLVADEAVACGKAADLAALPGRVLRRAVALQVATVLLLRGGDPTAAPAEAAMLRDATQAAATLGIALRAQVLLGRGARAALRPLELPVQG